VVLSQGPNYALAKRLQHWLAVRARAEGFLVSSNVAPSTATVSVVHNAQFAAAYGGFKHFKPMEVRGVPRDCTAAAVSTRGGAVRHVSRVACVVCQVLYQETSNAVMGALLLFDVSSPRSKAQPASFIGNAMELFSFTSFHSPRAQPQRREAVRLSLLRVSGCEGVGHHSPRAQPQRRETVRVSLLRVQGC
jgi:hypothetical protein